MKSRREIGTAASRHKPPRLRASASISIRRSGDQKTTNGNARKVEPAVNAAKRSLVDTYMIRARQRLDMNAHNIEIVLPTKNVDAGPKSLTLRDNMDTYSGG